MTASKNKRLRFPFLWFFTVMTVAIVCGVVYRLVVMPMQMDRACASHTDNFCMAVMDPEGIGYNEAAPFLAIFSSLAVLWPVSFLWYERLASAKQRSTA